jgi:hypothetical protein
MVRRYTPAAANFGREEGEDRGYQLKSGLGRELPVTPAPHKRAAPNQEPKESNKPKQ